MEVNEMNMEFERRLAIPAEVKEQYPLSGNENRLFLFLAEGFGRHPCHALEKFPEEAYINKVQLV
jgi:hypothetical protein